MQVDADLHQDSAADISDGDCQADPIGAVQPFGFLIAVSADWLVLRVSMNTEDHLGIPAREMLGKPLREIFNPDTVHAIRNRMMLLRESDATERMFSLVLRDDRRPFDIAVHFSGSAVIIEGEPTMGGESETGAIVRAMVTRLQKADTMDAFLSEGARHVRVLTGFDRVMVCRSNDGGGATVVAEAVRTGVDSFLGQDIPEAAIPDGALCLRNSFRIVANVGAVPAPLLPDGNTSGAAPDEALCILRPPSPAESDYMRHLGIEASFAIPIVRDDSLWGLFACHHYKPRLPNFAQRGAAERFVQTFALMLKGRETYEQLKLASAVSGRRISDAFWLIRRLIAETRQDARSLDAFADTLDSRIAALLSEVQSAESEG